MSLRWRWWWTNFSSPCCPTAYVSRVVVSPGNRCNFSHLIDVFTASPPHGAPLHGHFLLSCRLRAPFLHFRHCPCCIRLKQDLSLPWPSERPPLTFSFVFSFFCLNIIYFSSAEGNSFHVVFVQIRTAVTMGRVAITVPAISGPCNCVSYILVLKRGQSQSELSSSYRSSMMRGHIKAVPALTGMCHDCQRNGRRLDQRKVNLRK